LTAIIAAVEKITDRVHCVEAKAMCAVSCNSTVTGGSIDAIAPFSSGGQSLGQGKNLVGKAARVKNRDEKHIVAARNPKMRLHAG
jgi:hypothetical protein